MRNSASDHARVEETCGADDKRDRHWFALYTASNHEKAVEEKLLLKDVETFLPLHSVVRRWKNRTNAKLRLPLFPSYVFVKISLPETALVLSVPRVFSIVGNGREPLPLPDDEVEALRSGLNTENATPWPTINVGARARIVKGPLAGLEGIVVRHDGQLRVVLTVNLISKSIAVHVSADDIQVQDGEGQSGEDRLLLLQNM